MNSQWNLGIIVKISVVNEYCTEEIFGGKKNFGKWTDLAEKNF